MSTTLNPYLNFRNQTREAMEFYHDVFGGQLDMLTFDDYKAAQDPADGPLIMHAFLKTPEGMQLMASDVPTRMPLTPGTNFGISLGGENEATMRAAFDKLSHGGSVEMPLEKAMWGDIFGMCTDKFGIRWLVNVTVPQEATAR